MTKTLWLVKETDRARLWALRAEDPVTPAGTGMEDPRPSVERANGLLWIPRSVCPQVLKYALEPGEARRRCQVEIEDWWWEKNGPEGRERAAGQGMMF